MKIDLTAAWLVAGMSDGGDLTAKPSGMTWGDLAPTLADMIATIDALKPRGPAGYAVHPADVERLRRYFQRNAVRRRLVTRQRRPDALWA